MDGRPGRRSRTEFVGGAGMGAGVESLPRAHRDLRLGGSAVAFALVVPSLLADAQRLFLFFAIGAAGAAAVPVAVTELVALARVDPK